ncbi:MAG: hypothetical protein IAG13_21340 [Deltaproteobacteria bacterium]|nr:hypothetical protein [Nannocystaceae bacterium]
MTAAPSEPSVASKDAAAPGVADSAWPPMKDKQVVVERREGAPVRGKLIAYEGTHAVIVQQDGQVASISKGDATALKLDDPAAGKPAGDAAKPIAEKQAPKWKYHKLGLFTLHGVGYSRWRTPDYRTGGAAYNLDLGFGFNFSEKFGVYGLVGGAVGARIRDKEARGQYGHFALSFLARRKYIAFLPGIGLAISSRRGPGDEFIRETGVAIPIKLIGMIPLPKDLSFLIGLSYDLAIMARSRPFQSFALQVGVARF